MHRALSKMVKRRDPVGLSPVPGIVLAFSLVLAVTPASIFGAIPKEHSDKISPVLLRELVLVSARPEYSYPIPAIVQVKSEFFHRNETLRRQLGLKRTDALDLVKGYAVRLPPERIHRLLESEEVEYITVDAVVRAAQHLSPLKDFQSAIGLDQVRRQGTNIVIALLDSGIQREPGQGAATLALDFTSGKVIDVSEHESNRLHDGYGHGTHLAGVIGGVDKWGRARRAKIIDLKVIGDQGWGYTSNLVRAIQWVVENHSKYDIRVASLSLGHPPIEAYTADPLCQAVASMVDAGLVTVVSAGNLGRTQEQSKIWGGITSPGTEPSVITVGTANTRGTPGHGDDIATTYGSRGPTIDGLFKPDLVAPANLVPSTLVPGSWLEQRLPGNIVGGEYLALSGSSVATAFVSGAVAKLLQINGKLTPDLVKLILALTAVKLDQPAMLEQGNGLLNAKTASLLARNLDVQSQGVKKATRPYWFIGPGNCMKWERDCSRFGRNCDLYQEGCERVVAGGAFCLADQLVYSALIEHPQSSPIWGSGVFWPDAVSWFEGMLWSDGIFRSDGVSWSHGSVGGNGTRARTKGVFWTDGVFRSDGVLWSNGAFWSDGVFWSDSEHRESVLEGDPN